MYMKNQKNYITKTKGREEKMSSLYKLNENYQELLNMLYQDDIDEQMILDTLESIEGEIEDKADNYAYIITEILNDANACKQEKDRLEKRQKSLENKAKNLKKNLADIMKNTGKTNFKTQLHTFRIQKNGGKRALTIDGDVPREYQKTIIENDTDKIRQALENGEELSFAHLEPQSESLRIV